MNSERYLVDRLSVIQGLLRVRISGGKKKSLRIWLPIPYFYRNTRYQLLKLKKNPKEYRNTSWKRIESRFRDYIWQVRSGFKTERILRNLVIKGDNFSF